MDTKESAEKALLLSIVGQVQLMAEAAMRPSDRAAQIKDLAIAYRYVVGGEPGDRVNGV